MRSRAVRPLVGTPLGALVLIALTAGAYAVAARPAHSTEAARTVDQTYVCSVAAHNGVREITLRSQRGFRDGDRWRWLASTGLRNENRGPPARLPMTPQGQTPISYENWGFGVSAGLEPAHPEPSPPLRPYRARLFATPRRACTTTIRRIPLSPRGLTGYPADYFGDEAACRSPAKVVVRVRAVFSQPATFRVAVSSGELRTRVAEGGVVEGQVAMRTVSGKPLAHGDVHRSGKARLFFGRECTSE